MGEVGEFRGRGGCGERGAQLEALRATSRPVLPLSLWGVYTGTAESRNIWGGLLPLWDLAGRIEWHRAEPLLLALEPGVATSSAVKLLGLALGTMGANLMMVTASASITEHLQAVGHT